ncbi:dihydrofolate reductase family protein [Microterricola pindariensis]|uniref:5-amino-6-(5-phosphoribosylamino)uracil reductase n=1 Tax=Microterricola pindariensis TaxID=478010 RepID=A0ABX5AYP9_9MICO|nr:dihydrofolate reductase family protein [Microterricola pindariensis]PPL19583.1 5-amino-6-(5-phosphoribosylamino)uracil reductase [Microterricola pindariensis]
MNIVFCDMAVSVDGFSAGPNQSLENPLGVGGLQLHRWHLERPEESAAEIAAIVDAGAFIMGRNMFGPIRGPWDSAGPEEWRGWWGEEPPYHGPVFVLTHYPRESLEMEGGTTFHFVTDGIAAAHERALAASGGRGVSIAGGASTVQQALSAGLLDELRLHIAPVVLGAGERLLEGVGDVQLEQLGVTSSPLVTHVRYKVLH